MKNTILIVMFFSLFLNACINHNKSIETQLDQVKNDDLSMEPTIGFRGIRWGEDPATIQGFKLDKNDKYGSYYYRENESLSFANADIYSITYNTYNNKLYLIRANFSNEKNFIIISSYLTDRFGDSSKKDINQNSKEYSWDLNNSNEKNKLTAKIIIKFNDSNQHGDLTFVYTDLRPPLSIFDKK